MEMQQLLCTAYLSAKTLCEGKVRPDYIVDAAAKVFPAFNRLELRSSRLSLTEVVSTNPRTDPGEVLLNNIIL